MLQLTEFFFKLIYYIHNAKYFTRSNKLDTRWTKCNLTLVKGGGVGGSNCYYFAATLLICSLLGLNVTERSRCC